MILKERWSGGRNTKRTQWKCQKRIFVREQCVVSRGEILEKREDMIVQWEGDMRLNCKRRISVPGQNMWSDCEGPLTFISQSYTFILINSGVKAWWRSENASDWGCFFRSQRIYVDIWFCFWYLLATRTGNRQTGTFCFIQLQLCCCQSESSTSTCPFNIFSIATRFPFVLLITSASIISSWVKQQLEISF